MDKSEHIVSVVEKMGLAVFESAGEAIVVTDLAATIQYVNPAFERITGYSRDEAIGRNPRILKSGQHNKEVYQELWSTLTKGGTWRGSFINRKKDGALYHTEQTIAPVIQDDTNTPIGFVSVHVDVTERRQLQAALHAAEVHRAKEAAEHELKLARREMEVAGKIQTNLFPQIAPEVDGLDIAGAAFPAEQTSGDYYDFVPMQDGTLAVVVGDVSGHGLGPALLMAETRACLRSLALCGIEVDEILRMTNQLLAEDVQDGRFVTLFFARLNPLNRSFSYAAAGHSGHHIGVDGVVTPLPPTGLPLGVEQDAHIHCTDSIQLRPGELLLMMTDGLWETRAPDKSLFGVDRVLESVHRQRKQTAQQIAETLQEEARQFSQHQPQQDDTTIVVVKALI